MPNKAIAAISRLVAIGRRMNPSEMFMAQAVAWGMFTIFVVLKIDAM